MGGIVRMWLLVLAPKHHWHPSLPSFLGGPHLGTPGPMLSTVLTGPSFRDHTDLLMSYQALSPAKTKGNSLHSSFQPYSNQ